jgi:hypothetical protein
MGWATFWATFSQPHLVTLVVVSHCIDHLGRGRRNACAEKNFIEKFLIKLFIRNGKRHLIQIRDLFRRTAVQVAFWMGKKLLRKFCHITQV